MVAVTDMPMFAATHVLMFVAMAIVVVLASAMLVVSPHLHCCLQNERPVWYGGRAIGFENRSSRVPVLCRAISAGLQSRRRRVSGRRVRLFQDSGTEVFSYLEVY